MSEQDVRDTLTRIDKLRSDAKKCNDLSTYWWGSSDVLTLDRPRKFLRRVPEDWVIARRRNTGKVWRSLEITGTLKDELRNWLQKKESEWREEADRLAETLKTQ